MSVYRSRRQVRAKLMFGVAAVSLIGFAGTANAQTAPAPSDQGVESDSGDIVISGYRQSIEKSLEQKRAANAIVEVITAEDIGKFPDKNVADALQRVPGVVIGRSGGEGKTVSVRGLDSDLTLTELNGNYIASSETNDEASRSFNYLLLPSNMLGSAELYKTPEARLDEGGIGGTVILRTRRPLDMPSLSGFLTAEGTYSDTTRKIDPQVSGMLSWKNKDETFGILAGVTWQRRTNRSMEASTESWQWYADKPTDSPSAVDVNGNVLDPQPAKWWGASGFYDQNGHYYTNFFMPTAVNFGVRDEKRERLGIQGTVQWKPTSRLTLTGNYFRFQLNGDYVLNSVKVPEWNLARYNGDGNWPGGRLLDAFTFDKSGTVVTGAAYSLHPGKAYYCTDAAAVAAGKSPGGWGPDDCTVPTPQLTGAYSREKALSQTAEFVAEYKAPLFEGVFKAGRTWSTGGPSINFRMSAKPRRPVNGVYVAGNTFSAWDTTGTPTMTFADNLQDQIMAGVAEIDVGSTDSSWKETSLSQNYAQADFTKSFDDSWLNSIQFGAKYRAGKVSRNTGNTYWYCKGTTTRYQDCDSAAASIAQPSFFLSNPITNLPGGFNVNVFPAIDYPAYLKSLDSTYGAPVRHPEPDFIYRVNEKILAGYIQANIKAGRLRGNIGLRVVRTKQHAESTDSVESFLDYFADGPDGNPLPCAGGANCESGFVKSEMKTKTFELNTLNRTYTDILPSLNLAYDVTNNVVLRGAVSKVIARPAFSDVAFPGSLQYISTEYSADRRFGGGSTNPGWYGNGSNKSLKPFEAWQFDASLEWYFHPGSVLGIGLFRKNVDNFVVPVVRDTNIVIGGQSVTVQNFSTSANGRKGVSQGIELYAQHTFDFGLGFQANLTLNDTNLAAVVLDGQEIGKSPLVGSAKNQVNLTVFYQTKRFLARASYNRRGEVVGGTDNGFTIYSEPYSQIDLNVAYNITDQIILSASVLNLTKSEQRAHLGNDTDARFYSNNYSGRIAYAGVTFKF